MSGVSELVQTADRGAVDSEVGLLEYPRVRSRATRVTQGWPVMVPLRVSILAWTGRNAIGLAAGYEAAPRRGR